MRWTRILALSLPLLLLTACHDDVIPTPLPPSSPGPAPNATFVADSAGSAPGVRLVSTEVLGRDRLQLALETTWITDRLTAAYLLVRVDPRARAHIGPGFASWWCGANVRWYSTENPGEWLLERPPSEENMDCLCPDPPGEPGHFTLARMEVTIGEPGAWRIDVMPASGAPVCDCNECLMTDMGSYGGTIHVAAP